MRYDDGTQKKDEVFLMRCNGDFLRAFFQAALVLYFQADMAVMARELGYSIEALNQAMECRYDEMASRLFERLTQYCIWKRLSIDFLLKNAIPKD